MDIDGISHRKNVTGNRCDIIGNTSVTIMVYIRLADGSIFLFHLENLLNILSIVYCAFIFILSRNYEIIFVIIK